MGKQRNKLVGARGEKLAKEFLQIKGYTILGQNYRSKWGEIDIVASCKWKVRQGWEEVVVFVEVKTKTDNRYGEPWEMVNQWKIEQVKRMGEAWCRDYGWEGSVRMDVIGILLTEGEEPAINHYENV